MKTPREWWPGMLRSMPLLLGLLAATAGCGLSERSFPLEPGDVEAVPPISGAAGNRTARAWLAHAHRHLAHLLPAGAKAPLLTGDMTGPDGAPVDVFRHFGVNPDGLEKILSNYSGLKSTAQGASASGFTHEPAPPWPGFEDVRVPVSEGVKLSGRLGLARRDGRVLDADCLVVLPGILGDNHVMRSRDLSAGLLRLGFHVLALELRGHGQTDANYPELGYTWGGTETGDLLRVSEWLTARPHVRRTGLIGFCWSSNHVLLSAWYDNCPPHHPSITPVMERVAGPRDTSVRHYTAGVIAFSPVFGFEEIVDKLDRRWSVFFNPALWALQSTIRERTRFKHYPKTTGSLRELIAMEVARGGLGYPDREPNVIRDGYGFLRFRPYKGRSAGNKLAWARVPTLIVHGANDPLARSQYVADVLANVNNPNVAGIILPGGGHVGFAPYAHAYYVSLIANFFDPTRGPVGIDPPKPMLADRSGPQR